MNIKISKLGEINQISRLGIKNHHFCGLQLDLFCGSFGSLGIGIYFSPDSFFDGGQTPGLRICETSVEVLSIAQLCMTFIKCFPQQLSLVKVRPCEVVPLWIPFAFSQKSDQTNVSLSFLCVYVKISPVGAPDVKLF